MIFPDVAAALDAIRDLAGPSLPAGVIPDDGLTEPMTVDPLRLYAWPRRIAPAQGATEFDIGSFTGETTLEVRILVTLAAKGEPRIARPDRELSAALLAAAGGIVKVLTDHDVYPGSGSLWQSLAIVAVIPDAVRTVKARGYGVDVRLSMPWPETSGDSGGGS